MNVVNVRAWADALVSGDFTGHVIGTKKPRRSW